MKDIDTKRPRRLDLNAPLISTRRSNITSPTSTTSLGGSCDRVPFSWESIPGKPKGAVCRGDGELVLPLPKPPFIRWQLEDEPTINEDDTSFSDAIDLFSLAESLNTSERMNMEGDINEKNGSFSPNFMIQRFLPAATALAASSLSALSANKDHLNSGNNHSNNIYTSNNKNFVAVYSSSNHFIDGSCVPRVAGEAYTSSKGCGLQILFPWRAKHRLCGVKSPVRKVRSSLKPQLISPGNKLS